MTKRILIILGSPNSPKGLLSTTAKSRLNLCLDIYVEGDLVLCTGGWGEHFNTSNEPHSFYAKKYLLKKGILNSSFLDFALSSNTVDDAVKATAIISTHKNTRLVIITSDFHLERVQLIFTEIFNDYSLSFLGAKSELTEEALKRIVEHEKKATKKIIENGLYY